MIIRAKLHWFRMLFVWRGSVLTRILPQLFTIITLAVLVLAAKSLYPALVPDLTPLPFTLLGIALAIFLSFRNSVSYDRFWEARKLWGAVLNESRTLARQQLTAVDVSQLQRQQLRGPQGSAPGPLSLPARFAWAASRYRLRLPDEPSAGAVDTPGAIATPSQTRRRAKDMRCQESTCGMTMTSAAATVPSLSRHPFSSA